MTTKDKSGRLYNVYIGIGGKALKRPRRHRASASREFPAVITGRLRKSVDFSVRDYTRLDFGAGGSGVNYARALELGNSSRNLAPRYYLKQTLQTEGKIGKTLLRKRLKIASKK